MKACVGGTTEPTPFVVADSTGHMVTARHLFNQHVAFGTALDILVFSPLSHCILQGIGTISLAMVFPLTLGADSNVAILTDAFQLALLLNDDDVTSLIPTLIRAPEVEWIGGNQMVEFELLILLKLFLTDHCLDLVFCQLNLTMRAGHSLDLILVYLRIEVQLEA